MTYSDIRQSLSFLESDFTSQELARLFPNETVGLRRAANAGCCALGTKHFARAMGFDTPPTLTTLAGMQDYLARYRRHYISGVIAYTVALRLSRHTFVCRQYAAYIGERISWGEYSANVRDYTKVLIAARKVGRMGI